VFFDVDEQARVVRVLAIGAKDHERLTFGGQEYGP